eukprot:1625176-Lingulodinium_polyedra.AAC.1
MARHCTVWHGLATRGTAWHYPCVITKRTFVPKYACPPECGLAPLWGQGSVLKAGQTIPLLVGLAGG